ncbi:MAG: hypothetical protein PHV68_06955, partial [Candidatus Gastranaerophilales bacterium]|nr:hypothetical protein [Candidatus Gastranaerophilales bacterium]
HEDVNAKQQGANNANSNTIFDNVEASTVEATGEDYMNALEGYSDGYSLPYMDSNGLVETDKAYENVDKAFGNNDGVTDEAEKMILHMFADYVGSDEIDGQVTTEDRTKAASIISQLADEDSAFNTDESLDKYHTIFKSITEKVNKHFETTSDEAISEEADKVTSDDAITDTEVTTDETETKPEEEPAEKPKISDLTENKEDGVDYTIQSGDCLSTIIQTKYGKYSNDILSKIVEYNNKNGGQHIENANLINSGASLVLPSVTELEELLAA